MFSSNSSLSHYRNQTSKASYNRYIREEQERQQAQQAYQMLITKMTRNLFADVNKFKNTLDVAITMYLSEVKDGWFRNAGRERAILLQRKVAQAKSTDQLVGPLAELIQAGSNNHDSLKTFIFKKINTDFCENRLRLYEPRKVLDDVMAGLKIIKTARDKIALCFGGLFSSTSNFSRLPRDVVRTITSYLS